MVKRIRKNIYLSPLNLAPLRLGGRNFQIRELVSENLRQSRKFRAIVVRNSHSSEKFLIKNSFTPHSPCHPQCNLRILRPFFISYPHPPGRESQGPPKQNPNIEIRVKLQAKEISNRENPKHGAKIYFMFFFALSTRYSTLDTRPSHLISLVARANKSGGIVRPICLAVFKLITNSNFVGCSTGRSAGLAPFRILST
jgi:hypothetical protein